MIAREKEEEKKKQRYTFVCVCVCVHKYAWIFVVKYACGVKFIKDTVCISLYADALEKGMNPFFLTPAKSKY